MSWRCICIVAPKINALADEDQEQDPDRWVSQTAAGQEAWQLISQWIWNLRLELGHQLHPDPLRTTEFAPALPTAHKESPAQAPVQGYGPAEVALRRTRGPLLGARFCPPAGWDAALSSKSKTFGTRAAPGSRWQLARGLCRQYPQLPSLSLAKASSMEWQRHREAASSECALASIGRRVPPHPLEGLEPEAASAGVYATPSSSTRGGAGRTGSCCRSDAPTRAPVPCTARALSSRLSRAARAPRASSSSEPGDDPTVRRRRRLCHLAREGSGLTPL
jgi:hypothetical protein